MEPISLTGILGASIAVLFAALIGYWRRDRDALTAWAHEERSLAASYADLFRLEGVVPGCALSGMTYANHAAARLSQLGYDLDDATEPAAPFVRCAYCGGNLERSMRNCEGCGAPNRTS